MQDKNKIIYDVLSVGDAKIDIFLTLHEANEFCRIENGDFCVKQGQKIEVEHSKVLLGGNAANVAVGLSRLGLKSALVAEIGEDEFSLKINNTLATEQVARGYIKHEKGKESSLSVVINFQGDRVIFGEHVRRPHDFSYENASPEWIYLTSLGEEWKQAYEKAVRFVHTNHVKLAFNPGTLQIESQSETIANILINTKILFVNKEEGLQLLKEYSHSNGHAGHSIQTLLKSLKLLGPEIVVVSDGKNGSYCIDYDSKFYEQRIFPHKIVERTGAGDAYSTGFLAGVFNGVPIQEAMIWGTLNAGSVIGTIGAEGGLLKLQEMEEKLRK